MSVDKSLHLSLTKEDISSLLNKKKITKNEKKWNIISNITKILFGAGLGVTGVLGHMEMLALLDLVPLASSLGAFMVSIWFVERKAEYRKMNCDAILERIKLIAQQHCPERLIDGATFKVVRSNNVENNLKNYSFEQQIIHPSGEKTIDEVERNDLQIGTISTQFIISDKNGVFGAIEEIQANDVERKPTKDGSSESVVSTFTYKWVPSNEIRTPYEDADNVDQSKSNGKLKAKKQNNGK